MKTWNWFTKEEVESWPDEHKKCRVCYQVKPFSDFHKNGNGKQLFGIASDCKECRKIKSKSDWAKNKLNIKKTMIQRSKSRAKNKGIPFMITEDDIFIPDTCPVFNHIFILNDPEWTYSLDRIVPELGYVPNNIIVVSNKANLIKNNASPEEIMIVGKFYKNLVSA